MVQQGRELGLGAWLAAAFTRLRFGGKATRLCVGTLAFSRRLPRAGPFPPCISLRSTTSQVVWTSPTPDLSSDRGSGSALPLSPTGDQSSGPGRASHVAMIAFHA